MDEGEPRLRRRGMFFHVETPELDQVEHESAEGISIRQVPSRKLTHAIRATSRSRTSAAAQTTRPGAIAPGRRSAERAGGLFRSGNGTGSRPQAPMSR